MSVSGDDLSPLCPSAPASPGASLIGIVQNGAVVKLGTPLEIGRDFIDQSAGDGPLEARFRFSNTCQQGACVHWSAGECGLIDRLARSIRAEVGPSADPALPRCAIRGTCRWWLQRGAAACGICDFVVTDTRDPEQ